MASETTPMMKQYRQIKSELAPGTILFFRLGDFYEMFYEDAQVAAPILNIALTKRQKTPMCGVPYHSAESYLAKLIKAGKKVAICEQVEDPAMTKGIVRREVREVVTPGTVTEESILESNQNNYLAGLFLDKEDIGMSFLDLSTGAFWVEQSPDVEVLLDNMNRYRPTECAVPEEQMDDDRLAEVKLSLPQLVMTPCQDWTFEYDAAYDTLIRHFQVKSLDGYGCEGEQALVGAAGGMFYYVREELHRQVTHIRSLRRRHPDKFLILDKATCINLDLVSTRSPQGTVSTGSTTLLSILDATRTAMGGRLMRDWILRPLSDKEGIIYRQQAVDECVGNRTFLNDVRDALGQIRDIERMIARLSAGGGNARDLRAMGVSLENLPSVKTLLSRVHAPLLKQLSDEITLLPDIVELIDQAIAEEPPTSLKDGGLIRRGYDPELDELVKIATEGRQWLAEYQASEQEKTGIKTLKVRHNKVFGYYIDVSKGQAANVPDYYVRKQTLVNSERYITPELKDYETKIVGALDRSTAMEYEIFVSVRDKVVEQTSTIQQTADALAVLDVLCSLADRASALRYVKPEITDDDQLIIQDGRHPVIEQMAEAERFVPNDATLDCTTNQLIILTGPNMAGKSTYIRQVGVISIMAHMGGFVPATKATIGVLDRVFTRVGAGDDLAHGRSTFMVEMQETANILNNATPRSLIILDEIGRGTSTFDGISIAWAVAEYLHNNKAVKAKTLFATHYHELTELSLTMKGVQNYNVLVKESGDSVVFLRKIVKGGADKSYGIQVARLAGLPDQVVSRAHEVLKNLEDGELSESGAPKIARSRSSKGQSDNSQLSLFG
jgi:DNA mismatch repair protein MutS